MDKTLLSAPFRGGEVQNSHNHLFKATSSLVKCMMTSLSFVVRIQIAQLSLL